MNIDTTATILQLSQPSASPADVAGARASTDFISRSATAKSRGLDRCSARNSDSSTDGTNARSARPGSFAKVFSSTFGAADTSPSGTGRSDSGKNVLASSPKPAADTATDKSVTEGNLNAQIVQQAASVPAAVAAPVAGKSPNGLSGQDSAVATAAPVKSGPCPAVTSGAGTDQGQPTPHGIESPTGLPGVAALPAAALLNSALSPQDITTAMPAKPSPDAVAQAGSNPPPIPTEKVDANGNANRVATSLTMNASMAQVGGNPIGLPPNSISKSEPTGTTSGGPTPPTTAIVGSDNANLEPAIPNSTGVSADHETPAKGAAAADIQSASPRGAAPINAASGFRAGLAAFRQSSTELAHAATSAGQPLLISTRPGSLANVAAGVMLVDSLQSTVAGSVPVIPIGRDPNADLGSTSSFGGSSTDAAGSVAAVIPQSTSGPVSVQSLAHRITDIVQQQLDKPAAAEGSSVVMRLDPPELGQLNVHVSVTNDVVSIRMVASDEAARQIIERQLNELQQSLTNQGVAFVPCQVQVGSNGQQSTDRGTTRTTPDDLESIPIGSRRGTAPVSGSSGRNGRTELNYVA